MLDRWMIHGTGFWHTRQTAVGFWAGSRELGSGQPSRQLEDRQPPTGFGWLWCLPLYVLVAVLVVVPPWLIGGVAPSAQRIIFLVALIALFGSWCLCLPRWASPRQLPLTMIVLALAIGLAALQTVRLNPDVHRTISPATFGWWQQLASCSASGSGPDEMTEYSISLYPSSTRRELYLLALVAAAFLLGAIVVVDRIPMAIVGVAIAINGAALAFFGLVQQLTFDGKLFWSIPLTEGGAPFASYVNRNNAAGMLNMCLACAIAWTVWGLVHETYWIQHRRGTRNPGEPFLPTRMPSNGWAAARRFFGRLLSPLARLNLPTAAGLTAAGCITAGVFSSLSRGGMVALIGATTVTLVAVALAGHWRHSWLGPILLPIVLGVLLIDHAGRSESVIERASTVLDKQARDAEGRWWLWAEAWDATKHLMPTGSGLGTFRYAFRLYQQEASSSWYYYAENVYVQTLVEAGAVGIMLLLAGLLLVAAACWHLLRASDPWSYALGIAGVFALASQAIHALFDFGLYLPANMLLLALICGAVCGRAAKIGGHGARAEPLAWQRPPWWIALPPLRPLAASTCVAIFGLLGLGTAHIQREVTAQAALEAAAELDLSQPLPIRTLDNAIAKLTAAADGHSQEVDVHQKLAQLWTARMRVELVESMKQDATTPASDAEYWSATDPNHLYGRIRQWNAQQMETQLVSFRATPGVLENLPQAIWHLRTARKRCPMIAEVHLMLAELTDLLYENADNQQDLQRVRWTAKARPATLTRCGWLELQAGRIDRACEAWQTSLALDARQWQPIVQVARANLDLTWHITSIVPACPDWILDVAVPSFAADADRPIRRSLLVHAERLLQSGGAFDAPANYQLGQIAMLRNDSVRAVQHLSRAVTLQPEETAWRYQLSVALHQAGRTLEAQQHARVCLEFEPQNPRYQALLRKLIRERTASQRRT
jgi:tetratricopeptide (TPR) repeat protein